MGDVQFVDLTDAEHRSALERWFGMLDVKDALDQIPDFQKVPGFGLAVAIVDRVIADQKVRTVMRNMQAVAAAGIDVTKIRQIGFDVSGGKFRLQVTMMDLADMMAAGVSGQKPGQQSRTKSTPADEQSGETGPDEGMR